jgi:hypothetical protein
MTTNRTWPIGEEHRVRWRRGPARQGWRSRLFQRIDAAKHFAAFLTRPSPRAYPYEWEGRTVEEELAPVEEIVIQSREVGPWIDSDIDVASLPPYRRGPWGSQP